MTTLDQQLNEPATRPQTSHPDEAMRSDELAPAPSGHRAADTEASIAAYSEPVMGQPDQGQYSAVMGQPDQGQYSAVMGQPDQGQYSAVMGQPDQGQYSAVMGQPDHGQYSAVMGEPDHGQRSAYNGSVRTRRG